MPFATFSDELKVFDSAEPFNILSGIKVTDKPYTYGNITWSGDAVWLAVTPSTDPLAIYKLENKELITYKYVNEKNVKSATFLNWMNRDIIYGLGTGEIRVWNIKKKKISRTIDNRCKQSVDFLSCNIDDSCIASGSLTTNNIGIHSLKTNMLIHKLELPEGELTSSLRFCQCKKSYIAASSSASTICVWDVNYNGVLHTSKDSHRGACSYIMFSPVNFSVLVTVSLSQQLKLFDLRTNEWVFDVDLFEPLHCVDMFQNGDKVVIGTGTGSVILYDLRANKIYERIKAHNCVVNAISINNFDRIVNVTNTEVDSPDIPPTINRTLDLSVIDVFSPVIRDSSKKNSLDSHSQSFSSMRFSLPHNQFQNDSFLSKMLSPKPPLMFMSSPIVQDSPIDKSPSGTSNGGLLPVLEEGSFESPPSQIGAEMTEICMETLSNEIAKIQEEQNHLYKFLSEQLPVLEEMFINKIQTEYDKLAEMLLSIISKNMEKSFFEMRYELITQRIMNTEYFNKIIEKTDNIALTLQQLTQQLTELQYN